MSESDSVLESDSVESEPGAGSDAVTLADIEAVEGADAVAADVGA